ncbi:hypothetical protein K438DRAFT_1752657 [Mycena galopus ATCC 62051]|nr:hypothetical protein K438DRAFT_1752657 [Mycena galopus ATCC 62051]
MNMDLDQDTLGFKLEDWDEYGNEAVVGNSLLTEEVVYQGTQFINLEFLVAGDATEGNEGEPAGLPGAGEEEVVEDLTERDDSAGAEVEYNQGVTLNGGEDEDEHKEEEENSKTSLDEALEITDVVQREAECTTEELEKTQMKYEEMIRVAEQHKTDLEWQCGCDCGAEQSTGMAGRRQDAETIAYQYGWGAYSIGIENMHESTQLIPTTIDRADVVMDAETTGTINMRWTGVKPEYEVNATKADH